MQSPVMGAPQLSDSFNRVAVTRSSLAKEEERLAREEIGRRVEEKTSAAVSFRADTSWKGDAECGSVTDSNCLKNRKPLRGSEI